MNARKQVVGRGRAQGIVMPLANHQAVGDSSVNATARGSDPAKPNPIRVLVVDDHPVVRRGLISCLAANKRLEIVGEAANGKEAITKATALMPDVILMDLQMPKLNGLAATEVLVREQPQSKVLIASVHKDSEYLLRIMQAGARGYVSKEASPEEFLHAIETVAGGENFYCSNAPAVLNAVLKAKDDRTGTKKLSPREQEVLVAITDGLSNKEIASRLGLGVRTVETHRERIMRKLNIHTVAGLTRHAVNLGLISISRDRTPDSSS